MPVAGLQHVRRPCSSAKRQIPHLAVEVPGAALREGAGEVGRQLQDAVVHRHAAGPAAVAALLRVVQAQQPACMSSAGLGIGRRLRLKPQLQAVTPTHWPVGEMSQTATHTHKQSSQPHAIEFTEVQLQRGHAIPDNVGGVVVERLRLVRRVQPGGGLRGVVPDVLDVAHQVSLQQLSHQVTLWW